MMYSIWLAGVKHGIELAKEYEYESYGSAEEWLSREVNWDIVAAKLKELA